MSAPPHARHATCPPSSMPIIHPACPSSIQHAHHATCPSCYMPIMLHAHPACPPHVPPPLCRLTLLHASQLNRRGRYARRSAAADPSSVAAAAVPRNEVKVEEGLPAPPLPEGNPGAGAPVPSAAVAGSGKRQAEPRASAAKRHKMQGRFSVHYPAYPGAA